MKTNINPIGLIDRLKSEPKRKVQPTRAGIEILPYHVDFASRLAHNSKNSCREIRADVDFNVSRSNWLFEENPDESYR